MKKMDKKKKTKEKRVFPVSPQVELLLRETENHMETWGKEVETLRPKLCLLPPEQQEIFFLSLFKKENANLPPLLEALQGQEEKLDEALASTLGSWNSPHAVDLLRRMAAAIHSRGVAKAIRRSIFRLKSMGLPVEEMSDGSKPVFQPLRLGSPEGFLSPIDSTGSRMILLFLPQIPQRMIATNNLINDQEGIVDFSAFEASRKQAHEYLEALQKESPFKLLEADPKYCLGLIMEAFEIGQKKGKPPLPQFLKLRPLMGTPPPLPLQPIIYQSIKEEEAKSRPDLLDRSGSLFQVSFFESWVLSDEEMGKYLQLVREASASRLVLSPYQKEARVQDLYRQAVQELFDESRRLLYRRRLEEMAYCLLKEGKDLEARLSLAAAVGLEKESGLLTPHPFLLELVKRSLGALLAREEKEEKQKDSDLIIKP
jgi:hypothetical protein